jgi:glutamine synthetase
MIRVPDAGRFEFRLMDGAVNPYLGQAAILAAGLDGVENKRKPGQRLDIDMYAEPHKARGTKKLPLNLLDAIRLTDKSSRVRGCLGNELIDSYVKLKTQEWESYCRDLSDWERQNTLDC